MPLVGSLDLRFDTLTQGQHRMQALVARVQLTDSLLSVSDASFGAWGGRARAALSVGLGDSSLQPFALSLTLEDVAAASFLTDLSPGNEALAGTLDLELALEGMTDAQLLPTREGLVGRAQASLAAGRLAGTGVNAALADFLESEAWSDIPFTTLSANLDVTDGALEVTGGDLVGNLSRIVFAGVVDLSGAAEVSLALSVPPERLQALSLRRTGIGQSVVEQLRRANRPLDLGLHLSGRLDAPTLEPNAANAVALAGR